ncbi:MAG: TIGR03790 family protein [Planctomycetes bacterium]|nr:TIGR03790 family protein [Planctomycetota bacterium]
MVRSVLLLALLLAAPLWSLEPANVLVVYNDKAAGSKEIAEYYAKLRGVPAEQVLKISASEAEEITRDEFNKDVLAPVREYVLAHDNILCIVPVRGVPLKVKDVDGKSSGNFEGHDEASVDSELMLVRQKDVPIDAAHENPYLHKDEALTLEHGVLVVCRLDGETVELAKGLVDKAVLAEALGCEGISYLDTRGLTSNDGYQQRDDLMEKVEDAWKTLGIRYLHDTKPEVQDLSTLTDALHYYGWYAGGQTPKGKVRFRTGGIDVHLHSFAAATVRGTKSNWVGPLLSWNATCTYGTVYEPYTVGFPYEHVMWERLAKGYCFGEAGMMANHLLSWQSVFVGDPLYTPYPVGWKDRKDRARAALTARLVPNPDAAPVDETGLVLQEPAADLLRARAETIKATVRKDPKAALALFDDVRFLVQDMGLEPWLAEVAKPFDDELRARFSAMKAAIKLDLTDTAEFDAALQDWKGLPIHKDLLAFKDELAKDQEKVAAKLLKKAESSLKGKKWFKAWCEAAETAAHKHAESGVRAAEILEAIKGNADGLKVAQEESDKELKPLVEKAQKDYDKKRYENAAKTLGREWRFFPESDQRKAAQALWDKIKAELSKG